MTDDLIERLLEPDWHDPACPFLKHCYCDDGAPHDTVRHPLAREAAARIATQQEANAALRDRIAVLEGALSVFLGYDDRFQIMVGGNPAAVEEMMNEARATLNGEKIDG